MAPDNGMINCSLGDDGNPTNGDTCSFTCDVGFGLIGPQERRCEFQSGQIRWSGRNVSCDEGTLNVQCILYTVDIQDYGLCRIIKKTHTDTVDLCQCIVSNKIG